MENMINIIKTKTNWTIPNTIAKRIVEEIIPENGAKFRYLVGTDAKYLIDAVYSCRDDKQAMDDVINNIMGQYLS